MDFEFLDNLQPVSLDEISEAKLMNRIDTKYLANISCIEAFFMLASADYRVLQIGELRRMPYYTCYYDTCDTEMYREHQRGKKARQKVRVRRYEGPNELSFIEIKDKNNKGRTSKKRRLIVQGSGLSDYADFVAKHSRYELAALIPQIENHFYRITLVRKDMTERITIDTALQFHNLSTGIDSSMPEIMVIEWKRKALAGRSPMKSILKSLGIYPSGFSKYCVGMARTNPAIKQNSFKKKIRRIARIAAH